GNRSTFGDISIAASGTNPDVAAVYAALRSTDAALTVMAINKATTSAPLAMAIANFQPSAAAQVWQLTASNAIARTADVGLSGQTLSATLPPQSITLFLVPSSGASAPRPPTNVRIVTPN